MSNSHNTNRNREYHQLAKRLLKLTNKALLESLSVEELAERESLQERINDLGDLGFGDNENERDWKAQEKIRERRRDRRNDYDFE